MKFKQILAMCIATYTMVVPTVSAYANNSGDTNLPSTYISSSTYASTEYRDKYDSTSHYIYNMSSLQIRAISYAQNGTNCTNKNFAVIPANSKRFIYNSIYEWGYRNCRLSIRANISGSAGTLSGLWSPDSVGSYPIANP